MYKSQKAVIAELRELFEIDDNIKNGSTESNGRFCINKKQMQRDEVIVKLQNYFKGVGVQDGYVKVSPITFIITSFEVCHGKPTTVNS
ncbi:hypothetical protein [Leeuwenhoekiella sp. LLG6367-2.1]|uniref:hypothetical protein n=1 Tax=Leeuwenhoekiella sp. LLG6367-2.1 TaxID=3160833 RepID=UPI0038696649